MTHHNFTSLLTFTTVLLGIGSAALAQHAGDMWIGRTGDGRLTWDQACPDGGGCGFDPFAGLTVLAPDVFGGWSGDSPGFDRITVAQPEEDLYQLEPGAAIWLEVAAVTPDPATLDDLLIDPALYIYEPVSFTFYPYEQAGQVYRELPLGNHQLHKHVLWFVDELDPAFDPAECAWDVTLRLTDKGSTGYTPSDPFTLRFMIHAPIPGDLDCDEDVDLDDLAIFETCATGPMIAYDAYDLPAGCELEPYGPGLIIADMDEDGDIDQSDFGTLQQCYSGLDVPGDPTCAD